MIALPDGRSPAGPDFRVSSLIPIDAAGKEIGDAFLLCKTDVLIGRRESCDIVLPFPNVSAHHCRLRFRDGHWYVEDLGSRNRTRVNGAKVEGTARIDDGDTLFVAKHRFLLRYSA